MKDLKCTDMGGEALDIRAKTGVQNSFKQHSRAPSGAYWKFDCNWLQKILYENCWEGDDGNGGQCNIWERYFAHKTCLDTSAKSLKAYSFITMTTAMGVTYATFQ